LKQISKKKLCWLVILLKMSQNLCSFKFKFIITK
jgi:hypothetical protein